MRDRLKELIEKEGINPARFAEMVGVQRSSVSHILSGRNNPSLEFIQKILAAFPDVSSDWLISGHGGIYRITPARTMSGASGKSAKIIETGDLFSSIKGEEPVVYSTRPANTGDKSLTSLAPQGEATSEVGNNRREQACSEGNDNSIVERVVIFYTNHTFREYKPRE